MSLFPEHRSRWNGSHYFAVLCIVSVVPVAWCTQLGADPVSSGSLPGTALEAFIAQGEDQFFKLGAPYIWNFLESPSAASSYEGSATSDDERTWHADEDTRAVLIKASDPMFYKYETCWWFPWLWYCPSWPSIQPDAFDLHLASMSKIYTLIGVLISMEREPDDWNPEKYLHEFPGFEEFRDLGVKGKEGKHNIKIRHLLTHTSGLPFGLRVTPESFLENVGFFFSQRD